jgi:hypothetical protein
MALFILGAILAAIAFLASSPKKANNTNKNKTQEL